MQTWVCEFCGTRNEVEAAPEEVPTRGEVTYMMAPPSCAADKMQLGASMEDALVVFCIDISGSMCLSTAVSMDDVIVLLGSSPKP